MSSRQAQLRSSILYVAIIGVQWALAAVSFALLFGSTPADGGTDGATDGATDGVMGGGGVSGADCSR